MGLVLSFLFISGYIREGLLGERSTTTVILIVAGLMIVDLGGIILHQRLLDEGNKTIGKVRENAQNVDTQNSYTYEIMKEVKAKWVTEKLTF